MEVVGGQSDAAPSAVSRRQRESDDGGGAGGGQRQVHSQAAAAARSQAGLPVAPSANAAVSNGCSPWQACPLAAPWPCAAPAWRPGRGRIRQTPPGAARSRAAAPHWPLLQCTLVPGLQARREPRLNAQASNTSADAVLGNGRRLSHCDTQVVGQALQPLWLVGARRATRFFAQPGSPGSWSQ